MKVAIRPADEHVRQAAVRELGLLDTGPAENFDRFTRIARSAFNVPIALVSLIDGDRVWFKSRQGFAAVEAPRDISFCGHTIAQNEMLYIPDALEDPRFADSPLVTEDPNIRFYIGAPLSTAEGVCVGTLCLLDTSPRTFLEKDYKVFRDLADAVQQEMRQAGRAAVYDAADASRFLLTERLKRLEEFENRFFALADGSVQGVMVSTGQKIVFANNALSRLFGYAVSELLELPSWEYMVAPEDRERVKRICEARARNEEAPEVYEYRGLRKDGSHVWLENLSTPILWDGEPAVQAAVVDISDRKSAEAQLVRDEARFQDFAEVSSDWFWEMDAELRYTWFSERVEDFTGFPREWHYGKTREELGIPDGQEDVWDEHLTLLRERRPFRNFEFKREAPDGVKWVRSSGLPTFDANGVFTGYRGTGIDITEDMKVREAASKASATLKSAIDGFNETFALWDAEDRLVVFNERFLKHNERISDIVKPGVTFTDFTQAALDRGLYAEAAGCEEEWLASRLRMHRNPVGQFEQARGDGKWLLIHEQKLPDGATITISLDITDRKQIALTQQESEARFTDFARASADRFWEMDADFRFTDFFDMTREESVLDRHRILGRTRWEIGEVDPEHDRRWLTHKRDLEAHRPFRDFDYTRRSPDGEIVWWRVSGVPVFGPDNEFCGYRGTASDVTNIKQTESERDRAIERAAEASAAKSEFLANMSHELRTPLNAIIGFSDVMRHETYGPLGHAKYVEYSDDVSASAQHLLSLINEVLDISKIEAEKVEIDECNIDVGAVLEICASMLEGQADAKSIEVMIERPHSGPILVGDERMFCQIVINLLANAIKFTPEGGRISLETGIDSDSHPYFEVSDNGIGIPPNDISRVLQPFEYAENNPIGSHEGTGLGLPISKRFAELHGGTLELRSKIDEGTCVRVRFPSERVVEGSHTT